ncbi:Spc97 / Spc98 family protein [Toxoplasma gondii ARI]|uniref:Spc97 / Spc98 family protein n=1 Tax=Toxoplasma gondii ARI TaxID=1074872 RepID=A0A139Y7Y7_TOXGO|nr:Spc97 / Spc98 family protein [Toxoplasma gondii ARI]
MEDPGESRAPGAEAHSGPRRTISHSSHSSSHSIPSVGSFAASSLTRLASLIATAPLPPELRAAFPAHANPEKNSSPEKQAELQRVLEESVLSRVARAQATYGVAAPEASDSKTVHAQRQQVYGHLMRESQDQSRKQRAHPDNERERETEGQRGEEKDPKQERKG